MGHIIRNCPEKEKGKAREDAGEVPVMSRMYTLDAEAAKRSEDLVQDTGMICKQPVSFG